MNYNDRKGPKIFSYALKGYFITFRLWYMLFVLLLLSIIFISIIINKDVCEQKGNWIIIYY